MMSDSEKTTVLVVGATGATGSLLVEQLLNSNCKVRAIVRSPQKFKPEILNHPDMTIIESSILDLSDTMIAKHIKGCNAVVSCLGHVMDFKGIFGNPHKLCTDATRRLCQAIEQNQAHVPVKFVLMNSVGVANPELIETRTWYDQAVLSLLHHALPPHRDNEMAAEYLFNQIGKNNAHIEWCSVRPDSLINAEASSYELNNAPSTGIFTGRPTSRANVASFMAELIKNTGLWNDWKSKMPVIMNSKM